MQYTLEILLSNSLVALVLALLAIVAGRLCRRPALAHALWILVLLKLITPPLHSVKISWPAKAKEVAKVDTASLSPLSRDLREQERSFAALSMTAPEQLDFEQHVEAQQHGQEYLPTPSKNPKVAESASLPQTAPAPTQANSHLRQLSLAQSLLVLWGIGSLICLCVIALRIRRFFRLLRYAQPADARAKAMAGGAADRLGLKRAPRALFVPGAVCPMLISIGGRSSLLIPTKLWERLEDQQRESMLLHELAHLRRRDHWVRLVEILVTVAYWWHPLTWWARAGLRRAEEQCCDAWVMWAMPGGARDYAAALLEAVDLASAAGSVPALASGMGEFHDLKRRLAMIKQGTTRKAMGWIGSAGVCAIAAVMLPVAPLFAQPHVAGEAPPQPPPHVQETAPPADSPMVIVGRRQVEELANLDKQALIDRLAATQAKLEAAMADVQKMRQELFAMRDRLEQLQRGRGFGGGAVMGGGAMSAPAAGAGTGGFGGGGVMVMPTPRPGMGGGMGGFGGGMNMPGMPGPGMPSGGAMKAPPPAPMPPGGLRAGQPAPGAPPSAMRPPAPPQNAEQPEVSTRENPREAEKARDLLRRRGYLSELDARRQAVEELNRAAREQRIAELEAKLTELLQEVKSLHAEKPQPTQSRYVVTMAIPDGGSTTMVLVAPDANAAGMAALEKFPNGKITSIQQDDRGTAPRSMK